MAWLSDEEYELRQDCREKKSTAASAFKQRTHCGKSGCKLPSDFMTKKEIKAMNGECVSYRMSDPMNWETFKSMPNDLQKAYVMGLRDKFDCTDSALCEMFNVSQKTLSLYFVDLGLNRPPRGNYKWNKEKFLAWSHGANPDGVQETAEITPETPVEPAGEEIDIPAETEVIKENAPVCDSVERKRCVPGTGKMTFDGPIEEIVETLQMLLAGVEVTLDVSWTVIEKE